MIAILRRKRFEEEEKKERPIMGRSNGFRYLSRPDFDTLLGKCSDYAHTSVQTIIHTNECDRLSYYSATH